MHRSDSSCSRAVSRLVADSFRIGRGEIVVVTADERSDSALIAALCDGLAVAEARWSVVSFAQLPFQGRLADPHVPEPVVAAVSHCDVWLDLSFPYLAGSGPFEQAMKGGRTRYLLVGDLDAAAFGRLYGAADFDALFELQQAVDALLAAAAGSRCRIVSPSGTDVECTIGPPADPKQRHATRPGAHTIPGSAIFVPEPESVRGTVAVDAVFHRYFTDLEVPLLLAVDGRIRSVAGGADAAILDRALRRAGQGEYGQVIHFTIGLNPQARSTGRSFIEEIRVVGRNAVGMGLPWWVSGGGENHPDGVIKDQSLWIDGVQLLDRGRFTSDHPAAALLEAAAA